jgi:3-hydroxyacyl-[acyl-carrier protein] dehydratase/trans-2-decenoyl-[acyl-carrier protein] isomerase
MQDAHFFHTPKPSYSKAELLSAAQGSSFGPGNARLPAPPLLMLDRITEINLDGGQFGRGRIVAELDINPEMWFFKCHFPGDPIMPGCLGLDALWQIVGYWMGWSGSPGKGRALGVGEVKFQGDITPKNKLVRYEVDIHRIRRGALALGVANGRSYADGKLVYIVKDMKVGLIRPAVDIVEDPKNLPSRRHTVEIIVGGAKDERGRSDMHLLEPAACPFAPLLADSPLFRSNG